MSVEETAVEAEDSTENIDNSNESQISPLELSDEDVANFDVEEAIASAEKNATGSDDSDAASDSDSDSSDDNDEDTNSDDSASEANDADESGDPDTSKDADTAEGLDTSDDSDTDDTNDTTKDVQNKDSVAVNYEAAGKKLFEPFRANGKDMQIDSVDDAITLMQMGANFNKKMAGLKPNLKLMKMLQNNDLLDEGKLNYLIDLSKQNPEAIKKLIKDSGLDPLTIDVEKDPEYKAGTYNVDDSEVELDSVLSELEDSKSYRQTLEIISTKWDASSKKVLVESPDIIRTINQHVELGYYDKISSRMEKERMLGRLTGLNDIQAYKVVGDAINAEGGFGTPPETPQKPVNSQTDEKATKRKQDADAKKAQKRAASHNPSTPGDDVNDYGNILGMSDEEFAKLPASKFM